MEEGVLGIVCSGFCSDGYQSGNGAWLGGERGWGIGMHSGHDLLLELSCSGPEEVAVL